MTDPGPAGALGEAVPSRVTLTVPAPYPRSRARHPGEPFRQGRRDHGAVLEPDRVAGAVWGHLVGDAVGVPYEFGEPRAPDSVVFGATGSHGQPPGTWSDDGALMLALLDSLLEVGGIDPDDQGQRMLAWRRDGRYAPGGVVFDIGGTTAAAISAIEDGAPALHAGRSRVSSQANGSLMRILPLALHASRRVARSDLAIFAAEASRITHLQPNCQATCAVYTLVVAGLLEGRSPDDALSTAFDDAEAIFERLAAPGDSLGDEARLEGVDALRVWPTDHEPAGRGWVLDAFWSAWTAFRGAHDYADTIRRAVSYGHDTDTTAAIAGGLAGAFWGIQAIPAEWLAGMRDRELVDGFIDRLITSLGWRTSRSSPLRADWVPLQRVPGLAASTGALGMTYLLGKREHGWTGDWWRDLEADADRLRQEHRADAYLQLVEDHELVTTRTMRLAEVLAARGIELLRHPVVDMSVPADLAAYAAVVADVRWRVSDGQRVVVGCRGGKGRTGTFVACLLAGAGLEPGAAIHLTREVRPGTIERGSQVDLVRSWPAVTRDVSQLSAMILP